MITKVVASFMEDKAASKVMKALKAAKDPTGCSTTAREQPGPSIRQSLVKNDPSQGAIVVGSSARSNCQENSAI